MQSTIKFALGSLVGGFAVYGALAACGASGGSKSASAQPAGTTCAQWQVKVAVPPGTDGKPVVQPAGWEPFTGDLLLRQCVPVSP